MKLVFRDSGFFEGWIFVPDHKGHVSIYVFAI
jgi:hypothetical protein